MSSGKSHLSREIIKHMYDICYSNQSIKETEVVFISKSHESSEQLSKICKEKNFQFQWWKIIHSFDYLFKQENNNKHTVILFEDMSGSVNGANSKFNGQMSQFLFRSRHHNISLIYIMHGISHSMTRKSSFERIFLDNASGLFIFKPTNNAKVIYNYLKNFMKNETSKHIDEIFEVASKISTHPYIFIQTNKQTKDDMNKIRIDIFKHNLFLQSGV
jgi:hypothetical protein